MACSCRTAPTRALRVRKRHCRISRPFQAQHGGIWYWKPGTDFNVGIKKKIMGAHGPDGDEPLVYIRPGKQVTAAYYTTDDKLESVWSNPGWIKWLLKTHSGQLLLNPSAIPGD